MYKANVFLKGNLVHSAIIAPSELVKPFFTIDDARQKVVWGLAENGFIKGQHYDHIEIAIIGNEFYEKHDPIRNALNKAYRNTSKDSELAIREANILSALTSREAQNEQGAWHRKHGYDLDGFDDIPYPLGDIKVNNEDDGCVA